MLEHEQLSLLTLLRKTKWSDWCKKELSHELVRIVREDKHGRLPLTIRKERRSKHGQKVNSRRLVEAISRSTNNGASPELLWDHKLAIHSPTPDENIIPALCRMSEDCDKSSGALVCIQRLVWVIVSVHIQLLEQTLSNQGNGRLTTAAIANIAQENDASVKTVTKLAAAGKKVTKLMSVFGVFAVLRMDSLSLDFLSSKLSDGQIGDAASSMEGSEILKKLRLCDGQACEKVVAALEKLERFGFDMEAFTTASTDLGNVLTGATNRTLKQLREQSQAALVAVCQEPGRLTSRGQWRPCMSLEQPDFAGFAQPLSALDDAGRVSCVDEGPVDGTQHLQVRNEMQAPGTHQYGGVSFEPTNDELGDFELLSWNYAFQYLDTN